MKKLLFVLVIIAFVTVTAMAQDVPATSKQPTIEELQWKSAYLNERVKTLQAEFKMVNDALKEVQAEIKARTPVPPPKGPKDAPAPKPKEDEKKK